MDFCEYLKDCRKKQNLTLTKAAQMMGISSSYLSSLEGGTRPAPAFEMLNKMADVLNVKRNGTDYMTSRRKANSRRHWPTT